MKTLFDQGVKVTVNSDDPPFFNATIQGEYKVMEDLGLNEKDLTSLTHNAIKYSFYIKNKGFNIGFMIVSNILSTFVERCQW